MANKTPSEAIRCIIIYKSGAKTITNNFLLFGDPDILLATFRYQLVAGRFSSEEFWLQKMSEHGAIYRQV